MSDCPIPYDNHLEFVIDGNYSGFFNDIDGVTPAVHNNAVRKITNGALAPIVINNDPTSLNPPTLIDDGSGPLGKKFLRFPPNSQLELPFGFGSFEGLTVVLVLKINNIDSSYVTILDSGNASGIDSDITTGFKVSYDNADDTFRFRVSTIDNFDIGAVSSYQLGDGIVVLQFTWSPVFLEYYINDNSQEYTEYGTGAPSNFINNTVPLKISNVSDNPVEMDLYGLYIYRANLGNLAIPVSGIQTDLCAEPMFRSYYLILRDCGECEPISASLCFYPVNEILLHWDGSKYISDFVNINIVPSPGNLYRFSWDGLYLRHEWGGGGNDCISNYVGDILAPINCLTRQCETNERWSHECCDIDNTNGGGYRTYFLLTPAYDDGYYPASSIIYAWVNNPCPPSEFSASISELSASLSCSLSASVFSNSPSPSNLSASPSLLSGSLSRASGSISLSQSVSISLSASPSVASPSLSVASPSTSNLSASISLSMSASISVASPSTSLLSASLSASPSEEAIPSLSEEATLSEFSASISAFSRSVPPSASISIASPSISQSISPSISTRSPSISQSISATSPSSSISNSVDVASQSLSVASPSTSHSNSVASPSRSISSSIEISMSASGSSSISVLSPSHSASNSVASPSRSPSISISARSPSISRSISPSISVASPSRSGSISNSGSISTFSPSLSVSVSTSLLSASPSLNPSNSPSLSARSPSISLSRSVSSSRSASPSRSPSAFSPSPSISAFSPSLSPSRSNSPSRSPSPSRSRSPSPSRSAASPSRSNSPSPSISYSPSISLSGHSPSPSLLSPSLSVLSPSISISPSPSSAPTLIHMTEFLTDLVARRQPNIGGFTAIMLGVELHGGESIEILRNEPDPATFRGEYYYNSTQNVLYKKIIVQRNNKIGLLIAYWQQISNHTIGN